MAVGNSELQGYDQAQKEMMEENCIVVDDDDNIIGKDSKVNCHLKRVNSTEHLVYFFSTQRINY